MSAVKFKFFDREFFLDAAGRGYGNALVAGLMRSDLRPSWGNGIISRLMPNLQKRRIARAVLKGTGGSRQRIGEAAITGFQSVLDRANLTTGAYMPNFVADLDQRLFAAEQRFIDRTLGTDHAKD